VQEWREDAALDLVPHAVADLCVERGAERATISARPKAVSAAIRSMTRVCAGTTQVVSSQILHR
jgi:hypothetical protein